MFTDLTYETLRTISSYTSFYEETYDISHIIIVTGKIRQDRVNPVCHLNFYSMENILEVLVTTFDS